MSHSMRVAVYCAAGCPSFSATVFPEQTIACRALLSAPEPFIPCRPQASTWASNRERQTAESLTEK